MRYMITSLVLFAGLVGIASPLAGQKTEEPRVEKRPKVAGRIELHLRERRNIEDSGVFKTRERNVEWEVAKTAIIICDMWDDHYCKSAAQRVGVMAPKMNAVLTAARERGVMIIHAPSGVVNMYAASPYRKRMQQAPKAASAFPVNKWCDLDPKREPPMPVDTSKCACDDPVVGPAVQRFSKQHPAIDIIGYDGISDSGEEIYNFMVAEGIENVVLMGVHTNMCVLGRPFGIRQMRKLGKSVVLYGEKVTPAAGRWGKRSLG